jgi:transposase
MKIPTLIFFLQRNSVRFWINRFGEDESVDSRQRQSAGPQPIISPLETQRMVNHYALEPFTPTRVFAEEFDCSLRTVRRALHRAGVHHRKPAKKIILTEQNKLLRLRFAREYRDFDFSHAIFADEKCFKSSDVGRRHLWRVNNTRYEPQHVNPNLNSGKICVNMWGWMSAAGPGELVEIPGRTNGQAYLELLQESFLPTARVVYPAAEVPELIFFQDNCPIHTARVVQSWLDAQPDIRAVRWPSRSPDLNPIENLWGLMVQRWDILQERTRPALFTHCTNVWESLRDSDLCSNLVRSMRSRCDAVIAANGAATKY